MHYFYTCIQISRIRIRASSHPNQSLQWELCMKARTKGVFMRSAEILIRLRGCTRCICFFVYVLVCPGPEWIVQNHETIFTLASNSLRWTYFGPTWFIYPWTTLVHATLCISDVIDKCNSRLADVTFDWRHVIVTAVEHNNQTHRIITFLCRLLARFKSKFHK